MHETLRQAARSAAAVGPVVLIQGMQVERPIDVVKATALSADDKRTILYSRNTGTGIHLRDSGCLQIT